MQRKNTHGTQLQHDPTQIVISIAAELKTDVVIESRPMMTQGLRGIDTKPLGPRYVGRWKGREPRASSICVPQHGEMFENRSVALVLHLHASASKSSSSSARTHAPNAPGHTHAKADARFWLHSRSLAHSLAQRLSFPFFFLSSIQPPDRRQELLFNRAPAAAHRHHGRNEGPRSGNEANRSKPLRG